MKWVHFCHSIVSDSLRPYGLQCARLPCPSPTPRACSNSCPSSQWSHPTIISPVIPFSSCLQSFPASESFPMGCHALSPGDLPDPGIEPGSPTLQADALPSEPLGKPFFHWSVFYLQYYINFKGPMYWFDILIDYTSYKVVIKCSLYFLCYNYILVSYFMPSCL